MIDVSATLELGVTDSDDEIFDVTKVLEVEGFVEL